MPHELRHAWPGAWGQPVSEFPDQDLCRACVHALGGEFVRTLEHGGGGDLEIHDPAFGQQHDAEMRKLIRADLLILDDFCLHALDATETQDIYEIVVERHLRASPW